MSTVELSIPTLGDKFQDYRKDIPGDSFNFGGLYQADRVKYLAFHHSVTKQTAKDDGDWKKECDVIANDHMSPNGNAWPGVGYRFIIASDGTVAYVGDLSHWGAAVKGHNDEIISACMVGDFTKELPTDAQINSAHLLAEFFLTQMPQYPLLDTWDKIIGHKDAAFIYHEPANATACPGTGWSSMGSPNNELKWRIQTNTQYNTPKAPVEVKIPDSVTQELEQLRKENADLKVQLDQVKKQDGEKLNNFVKAIVEAAQKAGQ